MVGEGAAAEGVVAGVAVESGAGDGAAEGEGMPFEGPGRMSLTRKVRDWVPSEDQSSMPWAPSSLKKRILSPFAVRLVIGGGSG